MSKSLALKYRPQRFQDMIGQKLTAVVLQQMVNTDNVPSALLFSGPSGTGKTTAARILAQALNPEKADQDMFTIEVDAASTGGVADIRALLSSLRYETGGATRVVILDEAQSLTRDAFNVLLKPTEEPPPGVVFVLVTTHPEKIPETVKTRLIEFEFRSVTAAEIFDRLMLMVEAEGFSVSTELIKFIADTSGGSVRRAVTTLDQVIRSGLTTVDEYVKLAGITDPAPALLRKMYLGGHDSVFSELDTQLSSSGNAGYVASQLTACIRDLFVIKAGGKLSITGTALSEREDLASRIEQERLLAAIRILWDLKTRVRTSDDPRGNLELALMLITDAFTRGRETAKPVAVKQPDVAPSSPPVPDAPKKLTLDDIRRRASA